MNRIIGRGATPNEIDFPSPVYSATIMGGCEDVILGVGGGRRYGMPNAMVCVQITDKPIPTKDINAVGASDREKKKMAEYVPPAEGELCWDVDTWLDLGDDQPWSSSGTFVAAPPTGAVSNNSITSNPGNQNSTYVIISHLSAYSVIQHHRPHPSQCLLSSDSSSPNNSFSRNKLNASIGSGSISLSGASGSEVSAISRVGRKSLTENPNDPDKKCVCVSHINGAPITDAIIFAGQDDGSICISILVEQKEKDTLSSPVASGGTPISNPATGTKFNTKSLTISAEELAMNAESTDGAKKKNAHISTLAVQSSVDKDSKHLVLMLVCDDKKVRYVLLPSPTDVHSMVTRHGTLEEWRDEAPLASAAAATVKKSDGPMFNVATNATLRGLMKHLLVASASDLSLNFTITRSSLRMGYLFEGKGTASAGHHGTVVSCLVAYDSAAKTSVMTLSVLEVVRGGSGGDLSALRMSPIFGSGSDTKIASGAKPGVVYGHAAVSFPICDGAATNLSPIYPKLLSPSRRVMPPEFLVSTVEGELVLLSATFSGPIGTTAPPARFELSGALPPSQFPPATTTTTTPSSVASYRIVTGDTSIAPLIYEQSHACPPKHIRKPNSEKGWLHTEPISTMDVSSQSGLVVTADIAQKARITLIDGGRRALEERRAYIGGEAAGNKSTIPPPATLLIPILFDASPPGLGILLKLQLLLLVLVIVILAISLLLWDDDLIFERMLSPPVAGQV